MSAVSAPAGTAIAYLGHRAFDGLSVAAAVDVDAILVAEGGVTDPPDGPEIHCLERSGHPRRKWTSADIQMIAVQFAEVLRRHKSATLLPYAAVDGLPADTLAPSTALRRVIDDKREAKRLFAASGLPVIDGTSGPVDRSTIARAARMFDWPIVARAPFASTGEGTYLIDSPTSPTPFSSADWLLERYVAGYSLNVTAVALDAATLTYPLSVQLIGQGQCAATPFGYCGSDFAAATYVPKCVRREVAQQIARIGEAVRALGFRGVFGADFIVADDGRVLPVEINARYQNSTALLNFALGREDAPAAAHVRRAGRSVDGPVDLSQVLVFCDADRSVDPTAPGIYRNGIRQDDSCDPRHLDAGNVLVVGTVQTNASRVPRGASLARLIFRGPCLHDDLRTLRPHVTAAIRQVRSA